jgi:hypothetical protein
LAIHSFKNEVVKQTISDLGIHQTIDKRASQRINEQLVEMEVPKTRNTVT